jgi:hypothetical protein
VPDAPERECHCRFCDLRLSALIPDLLDPNPALEHVRRIGWSVVTIIKDDNRPEWAFSIGMWHTFGSPEIAMFGLRSPDMGIWINRVGRQVREGQPLIADGGLRHGVLGNEFPVAVRSVHDSWHPLLFAAAMNFCPLPPLPFVQLVWPDRHGRFPWEPGAGERCRRDQPSLWLAAEEHPYGVWTDP